MKWSSQHVTWCQFDAIKHFKWNWFCPLLFWLRGNNQLCRCSPLCIPSKIWAPSRHIPGLVWLYPRRGGRAKLFVLGLDQNGCESDYSPSADRVSGRNQRTGFWWLRYIPWESPCWCHHQPSSQQVGKQSHQWFALHLFFLGETQSKGDVVGCDQVKWGPFHALFPCTVQAIGDLPGTIPGAGALTTPEGGLFTLEAWPLLRSTVMPLACADLYCLSDARASIESDHLCTFLRH